MVKNTVVLGSLIKLLTVLFVNIYKIIIIMKKVGLLQISHPLVGANNPFSYAKLM